MGNGRLAVLMPTLRFDESAKHCIRTAAALGGPDVDVFIGDNSENPEKWDFLQKVSASYSNCYVFCNEKNIGSLNNWLSLYDKSDHAYLTTVHDDDIFTPDYFLCGLEILRNNADCAVANGLYLTASWESTHLNLIPAPANMQATPVERIRSYRYWQSSINYCVFRSRPFAGLIRYFKNRPYWPSYMDQFIAYALLCDGKLNCDPTRLIFINNNVRFNTVHNAQKTDAEYFKNDGLPADFIHLNRLCWTADVIHYFSSTYRADNLCEAECHAIIEILYNTLFTQDFLSHLTNHAKDVEALFQTNPEGRAALCKILQTPWSETTAFLESYTALLGSFNATVAARFRHFVEDSLLPAGTSGAPRLRATS